MVYFNINFDSPLDDNQPIRPTVHDSFNPLVNNQHQQHQQRQQFPNSLTNSQTGNLNPKSRGFLESGNSIEQDHNSTGFYCNISDPVNDSNNPNSQLQTMSNQLTMYNNSMNGNIHGNHAQNAIQSQIETPEIGLALDDLNSQNPPANKRPRVQQTLEENERHLMYSKVLTTSVNNIKQSHFSYGGSELQYNENNHGRNNFGGQRDAGLRDGLFDGAIGRNEVVQKTNKGSVLDCGEKVPPLKSRGEVKTGAATIKNREV